MILSKEQQIAAAKGPTFIRVYKQYLETGISKSSDRGPTTTTLKPSAYTHNTNIYITDA
jgi:hypothetical protein